MCAEVRVMVEDMTDPGKEFVFRGHTICTVGRADDCYVRLPNDMLHWDVSRHHCLLDIEPPAVRVRDLGSKNGTYINGVNIGQRARHQRPEAAAVLEMPECAVHGGDRIKVGHTILHVQISDPGGDKAHAAEGPQAGEVAAL